MKYLSYLLLLSIFPLLFSPGSSSSDPFNEKEKPTDRIQWLKVANVANNDVLNVRAAPANTAAISGSLAHNEADLIKLAEKNGWVKIRTGKLEGWVYSKYVTADMKTPAIAETFGKELTCFGGEPHWYLTTAGETVRYGLYGEQDRFVLHSALRKGLNNNTIWHTTFGSQRLGSSRLDDNGLDANGLNDKKFTNRTMTLIIEKTNTCTDDMSDTTYLFRAMIIDSKQQLVSGCCRH